MVFSIILLATAAILELVLGARLLWLARVTRGAPELSLGVAFFVDSFAQVAGALGTQLRGPSAPFAKSIAIVLTVVATGALLIGVVRVFEQHRPWLVTFAWALIATVALLQIYMFAGTTETFDTQFLNGRWVNRCFSALTFLWAASASLRARNACLRQMRVGLSSRLEATRFLLWALAAMAFFSAIALLFARDVLGMPAAISAVAHPFLALACVTAVWWTFFPPGWLERSLEGAHE